MRSSGVCVSLVQLPCKSGLPSGVRGTTHRVPLAGVGVPFAGACAPFAAGFAPVAGRLRAQWHGATQREHDAGDRARPGSNAHGVSAPEASNSRPDLQLIDHGS